MVAVVATTIMKRRAVTNRNIRSTGCGEDKSPANRNDNGHVLDHNNNNTGFMGREESVDATVRDDPVDISPSSLLMTKTGVDENDMAEVSVVDESDERRRTWLDCRERVERKDRASDEQKNTGEK